MWDDPKDNHSDFPRTLVGPLHLQLPQIKEEHWLGTHAKNASLPLVQPGTSCLGYSQNRFGLTL